MNSEFPLEYPAPVTGEEVDILLKTIREYTETLRKRVDFLEAIKIQVVALFTVISFALPVLVVLTSRAGSNGWFAGDVIPDFYELIAIIGGSAMGIASMYLYASRSMRAFKDVQRLSAILETLVRRGSQLRDRHNFAFTQKMYVDIGLADAESILQEARRTIRTSFIKLIVPGLRMSERF